MKRTITKIGNITIHYVPDSSLPYVLTGMWFYPSAAFETFKSALRNAHFHDEIVNRKRNETCGCCGEIHGR